MVRHVLRDVTGLHDFGNPPATRKPPPRPRPCPLDGGDPPIVGRRFMVRPLTSNSNFYHDRYGKCITARTYMPTPISPINHDWDKKHHNFHVTYYNVDTFVNLI